jgi:hypothetical protein
MEVAMYYKETIAALRAAINERYPNSKSSYVELKQNGPAPIPYLLWMCREVEKMDTSSLDEAFQAARWIGWICAHAELHGIWNNAKTRSYVRVDCANHFDKPHKPNK